MKHLFFIDPLSKLNKKKDSSLMMAHEFKQMGLKAYILFEEDFFFTNHSQMNLNVYDFEASNLSDGFYLASFDLKEKLSLNLDENTIIHMRIDPPFDTKYLRYLWMLDFISHKTKAKIVNNPIGIMNHNEKIHAFRETNSIDSFVGASLENFLKFIEHLKEKSFEEIILKPLDLYSGIGVEKLSIYDKELSHKFLKKVQAFKGAIICQPFMKEVFKGEYRSLYFKGEELGTILKRPNEGEFLTNIAQGAKFEASSLPSLAQESCSRIALDLMQTGVDFIAFDILGDSITEINITCPGLLVEVSFAYQKNLARVIGESFIK